MAGGTFTAMSIRGTNLPTILHAASHPRDLGPSNPREIEEIARAAGN